MSKSLEDLLAAWKALQKIAGTAEKNNKSLEGDNHYANKFHTQLLPLHKLEAPLIAALHAAKLDAALVKKFEVDLEIIKSPLKQGRKRTDALRSIEAFVHGPGGEVFSDKELPPVPTTEQVMPKSVVIPSKKSYLVTVVIQANRCYETRCYDACAVMIRKLIEILIIEVYEAHKKEAEIKNSNQDYLLLGPLVDAILKAPHWSLARESKTTLPKAKELGNRSAHNRRYVATISDVNAIIPGLRVLVDDLLHIAGLK